ncbi:hypothetical protein KR009_006144, partial [Drosophila setifemur]
SDVRKGQVWIKRTAEGEFLVVSGVTFKKTRAMTYRTYYHCISRSCPAFYVLVELSQRPRLIKHHQHTPHCFQCR